MTPSRIQAKICGVSTSEAVAAALAGKAGWLGFNFFPPSPRYVTAEAAARLAAPAVDVSSGVERGPGLKDPALITAFLDAVRRA
jgi:phosphoribosylanthranilate isomerase